MVAESDEQELRLGLGTNPQLLAVLCVSAALQVAVVSVPFLGPFFHVADAAVPWGPLVGLSLAPLVAAEVLKLLRKGGWP